METASGNTIATMSRSQSQNTVVLDQIKPPIPATPPSPSPSPTMPDPPARSAQNKRQSGIMGLINLLCSLIAPLVLYYTLVNHLSLVVTVIISSAPPIAFIIFNFVWNRKVEVLGLIIVISFVGTLTVSYLTDNVRIMLVKDTIITLLIGCMWLCTLLPIKRNGEPIRPLVYGMVEKSNPELYDHLWRTVPRFRMWLRAITWLWGLGLVIEFVAEVIVVAVTDEARRAADITQVMGPCMLGFLAFCNAVIVGRMQHEKKVHMARTANANRTSTSATAGSVDNSMA